MATDEQISNIVRNMDGMIHCHECGVRIRYGDIDCPRCGADIEELLRAWARQLFDTLMAKVNERAPEWLMYPIYIGHWIFGEHSTLI